MQQPEPIRVEILILENEGERQPGDSPKTQLATTDIDTLFTFTQALNFHTDAAANTRLLLASLHTCKAIRSECLPLFFSSNTFHLTGTENQIQARLVAFTEGIGEYNTAALRSLVLDIGELPLGSAYDPILARAHIPQCQLWDFLLKVLRTTTALRLQQCHLRARATFRLLFRRPPFSPDRKVFVFDLDLENAEGSWEDIMRSGRAAFEGRNGEWHQISGMLDKIREGLGRYMGRSSHGFVVGASPVQ